jgi:carbohydrate-binding DOMON domain-containing protein
MPRVCTSHAQLLQARESVESIVGDERDGVLGQKSVRVSAKRALGRHSVATHTHTHTHTYIHTYIHTHTHTHTHTHIHTHTHTHTNKHTHAHTHTHTHTHTHIHTHMTVRLGVLRKILEGNAVIALLTTSL